MLAGIAKVLITTRPTQTSVLESVGSVCVSAVTLKARLAGLIVDKKEVGAPVRFAPKATSAHCCARAANGYDFWEGHRWDRSRILPLRAFVTFSFFRQTECSKARGLDADGKLFSLVFLHRQRRISRALLFCSHSGPLLGILQSCCHRYLLSPRGPLRVRHLAKKNPAAGGPDTGLRTTKLCQYIRGQSAMAVLPLTRRADSQQPTYQCGGLQRCRR